MNYLRDTRKKHTAIKSYKDYFMCLIILGFGIFIMFSKHIIGYEYFDSGFLEPKPLRYSVGPLFMVYGLFRAWRGYKNSKMTIEDEE